MAYCKKCGAYVPDGLSACLACGYDELAEQQASGTAEERRRLEQEERLRQQAEERARREAEERARQEAERQRRANTYAYRAMGANTAGAGKNRILAALSYLSILWILPRFFCADDPFARYHARQGLVLFVFGIICDAISAAIPFGGLLNLFRIYCIYKGMSNALNERMEPLPYIGQFGEKDS